MSTLKTTTCVKTLKQQGYQSFRLVNMARCGKVAPEEGVGALHIPPYPLPYTLLPFGYSFIVLILKPYFLVELLSRVLWISLAHYQTWGRIMGTLRENYGYPKFLVRWTAAEVVWGLYLQRVSELGQSPQPLGPTLAPGSYIRNELCCWTPSWCWRIKKLEMELGMWRQ